MSHISLGVLDADFQPIEPNQPPSFYDVPNLFRHGCGLIMPQMCGPLLNLCRGIEKFAHHLKLNVVKCQNVMVQKDVHHFK